MDQKAPYALYIDRMHSEYIVAGAHVAFSAGNQNESFYGIHQDILPIQLWTAVKQAVVLYMGEISQGVYFPQILSLFLQL